MRSLPLLTQPLTTLFPPPMQQHNLASSHPRRQFLQTPPNQPSLGFLNPSKQSLQPPSFSTTSYSTAYTPSTLIPSRSIKTQQIVNSAALQADLLSKFDLNLGGKKLPCNTGRRKKARPPNDTNGVVVSRVIAEWTCTSCSYQNAPSPLSLSSGSSAQVYCDACGAPPPAPSYSNSNSNYQQQHQQQQPPPRQPPSQQQSSSTLEAQTLSQILGLTAPPPKPLNDQQWLNLEVSSLKRGDCATVCSICYEGFKSDDQVILTCSHTFHATCISQFEKFTNAANKQSSSTVKKKKVCPLCRFEGYEKKRTTIGLQVARRRGATRIQALFRAKQVRVVFTRMLRDFYRGNGEYRTDLQGEGEYYQQTAMQGVRRRKFVAKEASAVSDRLIKVVEKDRIDIDDLFAEFDKSLAISREVFGGEGGREGRVDVPDSFNSR